MMLFKRRVNFIRELKRSKEASRRRTRWREEKKNCNENYWLRTDFSYYFFISLNQHSFAQEWEKLKNIQFWWQNLFIEYYIFSSCDGCVISRWEFISDTMKVNYFFTRHQTRDFVTAFSIKHKNLLLLPWKCTMSVRISFAIFHLSFNFQLS